MKTLESYKEEFDLLKANKDFEAYESLAKACIEEYPNEELGYVELGKALGLFTQLVDTKTIKINPKGNNKFIEKLHGILTDSEEQDKYILSIINFIQNFSNVEAFNRADDENDRFDIEVQSYIEDILLKKITSKNNKKHRPIYLIMILKYLEWQDYGRASELFEHTLRIGGDDLSYLIPSLNPSLGMFNVEDYHCLKKIKIDDLKEKKEIYLLGENGVGKTLLLKSIVISLTQNHIENRYLQESFGSNIVTDLCDVEKNKIISSYNNLFAYGTNRIRASYNSSAVAKNGYSTLFDRDAQLLNPIDSFRKIRLNQTDGDGKLDIETVFQFISKIINFEDKQSFRIERKGAQFVFYELDTPTEFENLADGYRSVLLWLCDLIIRLSENQPYISNLEDFYGIVLVDEVDLFLHPKWEYKIVSKLREVLPNIQWFFTTHSPMLILGASEDAVFYKVYKVDGETQMSDQFVKSDFMDYLLNGIVTSPLFDIDPSDLYKYVDEAAGIYTGDFINGKIYSQIRERLKNKPEKIDTMIDWINEALDEFENPVQ